MVLPSPAGAYTTSRGDAMSSNNSRNGKRGAIEERAVAKRLGGKRYLANSGGPVDIKHDWLRIQVKSGLRVLSQKQLDALDVVKAGCPKTHLPCAVFSLREGQGKRTRRVIAFDLDDFAEWMGLP